MPLFAPGVSLKSATSSKLANRSLVMMLPPPPASGVRAARTVSTLSLISHLLVGNARFLTPRQPFVVLPSQSNCQPAAFSDLESALGAVAGESAARITAV